VKKRYVILGSFISILVLLSCNSLSGIFPSQKSLEETPPSIIHTPSSTQTSAIRSNLPCPVPVGTPIPMDAIEFDSLPTHLIQYLNSGGDLSTLVSILEDAERLPMESPGWVEDDFTGDGLNDIAITLIDPESESILPEGTLVFGQCQEDHYEIVFQSPELIDWGTPEILFSDDLNGDQVSDLLIGRQSCGAHTCFTRLEALVWNGETLENRLQGTSEDIPSPNIEVNPESNEITVTAEGIGSVGAGPFRRFIRQWTWDEGQQAFLPSPDTYLSSNFRIHKLHDADQAAQNGDYEEAIELYTAVIEDDELLDYMEPTAERPQLAAYASFRLMLTYLLMNELSQAETIHSSIMTDYPAGSPASDFAGMADAFWNKYQSSMDIGSACLAAQSFADSNPETILEPLYYGYANPTYEATDICPFTD
jgi:hypothetical protein